MNVRRGVSDALVVGGMPRVDLLPPEVRAKRKATARRRSLLIGVVGVAAVMVLAIVGAFAFSLQANVGLALEQQRTTQLLSAQAKYTGVRGMQDQIGLIKAAQEVGGSTEIDWKAYLEKIQATLPGSVVIQTVQIDAASPLLPFAQSTTPLEGPRVATIAFTATTGTFPQMPEWLSALETLPAYVDATPDSTTRDEGTGAYTVSMTMHVSSDIYDGRFAVAKGK
jgi:Tfp pilus assembly protein PilN